MLQTSLEYSFRNYLDTVGEIMKMLLYCKFVNSSIDKQQEKAIKLDCLKKCKAEISVMLLLRQSFLFLREM